MSTKTSVMQVVNQLFMQRNTRNTKMISFEEITTKEMEIIMCCFGVTCKPHLLEVIIIHIKLSINVKSNDFMTHGHKQGSLPTQNIYHFILLPSVVLQSKGKLLQTCDLANLLLPINVLQDTVIYI